MPNSNPTSNLASDTSHPVSNSYVQPRFMDINVDVGESFGRYTLGQDAQLLPYVSAVNIACGFHASDPSTLRQSLELAIAAQVGIGAHPSYPDILGFGRRYMQCSPQEIADFTLYQVGAVWAMCRALGGRLGHVKPHGALYNHLAQDAVSARAFVTAVRTLDPNLAIYALSGSVLARETHAQEMQAVHETFADRGYTEQGTLAGREQLGAVFTEVAQVQAQVVQLLEYGQVHTLAHTVHRLQVDSLCIHGDGVHALEYVQAIDRYLQQQGIQRRYAVG